MIRNLSFLMLLVVIFADMTSSAFYIQPVKAEPATIRVPDDYPLIQWAINAANSGDTISVSSGIYDEQIIVNKTVNLVGQDGDTAIIDAHGIGTVITVTAPYVNVTGFTIRNGEPWGVTGGYLVFNNIVESNGAGIKNAKIIMNNIVRNNGELGSSLEENMGIFGDNSLIEGNTVEENFVGIEGHYSTIRNNLVAKSDMFGYGLKLDNCLVVDNTIKENDVGTYFNWLGYRFSIIYHNNFINNTEHIYGSALTDNNWDNGVEGNYWSDYEGMDGNGDGIGDTLLPHLGVDNYPLVEPWSEVRTFVAYVWDDVTHKVSIWSNITIASFNFDVSKRKVSFNATGPPGKIGFVNVTIPKKFMWVDSLDEWNITINDAPLSTQGRTVAYNATHYFIYFTCNTSTVRIGVIGKYLVPEFPSFLVLPLFMIVTLLAVMVYRRKLEQPK